MKCPRAVIFDLDDTLAESFQAPTGEIIGRLKKLLNAIPIGIATAASFERMEAQFLGEFTALPSVSQLFIFPNMASQCYVWDSGWKQAYSIAFTPEEYEAIDAAIKASVMEIGLVPDPLYEPVIVNRGGKVAYAAIGFDAPAEVKNSWDPERTKRSGLKEALERRLPNVEVSIGGSTTIDITPKEVDKAHGVRWLSKQLGIAPQEMLYVGDALFEGGNDSVVIPTGIETRFVTGPDETSNVIDELLNACQAN